MADNIDKVFDALSIEANHGGDATDSNNHHEKFKEELDKTGFTIFKPKEHCGYFSWNPFTNDRSHKPLSDVRFHQEIIRHINIDKKPNPILPLSKLTLPTSFLKSLPRKEVSYEYPYGHYEVAALYVASKKRNEILNDLDFIFGGSVIHMLASKNESKDPFVVCRVPSTTNTLLVANRKPHSIDFSVFGYQFKRYVTTGVMDYRVEKNTEFMEHIHIMHIGNHSTLMCVAADSLNSDGHAVKIRAMKDCFWGTKVMFQMISNGTPTLCHGIMDRGTLLDIRMRSLSDVAAQSITNKDCAKLEQNILAGMKAIKDQMKDAKDDEVFQISFDSHGNLRLERTTAEHFALLPPSPVVKKLLQN